MTFVRYDGPPEPYRCWCGEFADGIDDKCSRCRP